VIKGGRIRLQTNEGELRLLEFGFCPARLACEFVVMANIVYKDGNNHRDENQSPTDQCFANGMLWKLRRS
jgi:hypothetical protein